MRCKRNGRCDSSICPPVDRRTHSENSKRKIPLWSLAHSTLTCGCVCPYTWLLPRAQLYFASGRSSFLINEWTSLQCNYNTRLTCVHTSRLIMFWLVILMCVNLRVWSMLLSRKFLSFYIQSLFRLKNCKYILYSTVIGKCHYNVSCNNVWMLYAVWCNVQFVSRLDQSAIGH